MSECVLEKRLCDGCGECLLCDLNDQKKCDNCCACLEDDKEMRTVIIKKDEEEHPQPEKRKVVRWQPKH